MLRPDATESEVQDLLLRAITESARQTEPLDAYTRDVLIHWGPADDAEERDDAADDAADDARNAEPDGDDSQARDDSQATLHWMSPVPADDAELNGEPDDATDDSADDAELSGESDDPHDFAERLIDEAHVRLIIQMTDPELAADINRAAGRDDAAQLISPLSR